MRFRILLLIFPFVLNLAFAQTPEEAENTPQDTLIAGYNIVPPFVVKNENGITGPSVWLWENIARQKNLTFVYKKMPLDSLLEGLENHTVDVGVSPLTITAERSKVIDFTSPYYIAYSTMMQRDEAPFSRAFSFLRSFFSVNFVRALGALAFVIFIFGVLIWLFERKKNSEEFGNGVKGLWEGFWWSAVTMTTVGYGDKSPRTVGGRIVGLIWMFTAIIIISGFTAGIASALTVGQIDETNSDISDFKEKQLGTISHSATSEWLKHNFFTHKTEYEDMGELLEALDKEEIDAIAYDRPLLNTIVSEDSLSKYKLTNFTFNPQFYAIGISQAMADSLQEEINISMLSNIEEFEWRVLLSENGLD